MRIRKWRGIMLAAVLALACLPACGRAPPQEAERENLVICADETAGDISGVVRRFAAQHPELDVTLELIPGYGSFEREAYVNGLRTRMLANNGPDLLYLLSSAYSDAVFGDEYKAMATGFFTDSYEYVSSEELAALNPGVLAAGQYEGRQYLIPMDYTMQVLYLSESSMELAQPVLAGGEDLRSFTEALPGLYALFEQPVRVEIDVCEMLQGGMMQYADGRLDIDRELFAAVLESNLHSRQIAPFALPSTMRVGDKNSPIIAYAESYIPNGLNTMLNFFADAFYQVDTYPQIVAIPNNSGGYTAQVLSYAAIPGNSKNPAAAAKFIEFMLAHEYQSTYNKVDNYTGWMHQFPIRQESVALYTRRLCRKQQTVDSVVAATENINAACFIPADFRAMVEAELEKYYVGTHTLDETIDAIQNKLQVYF